MRRRYLHLSATDPDHRHGAHFRRTNERDRLRETVVLHVAPEAAVGGPLAFVQTGDMIELDVPKRRLHLEVSDEKLARSKGAWKLPEPPAREMHRSHDRAMRPGRSRCGLGLWLRPLAACGDQARTFFRRLCRSQRNLLVRRRA
jgi:hypothetical protein